MTIWNVLTSRLALRQVGIQEYLGNNCVSTSLFTLLHTRSFRLRHEEGDKNMWNAMD